LSTFAGILAVLLWASTIAFSKSGMEKEGNYNLAFYNYFFSGIFMLIILSIFQKKGSFFRKYKTLPLSFYFKTGIFLVMNNVFLLVAIGLARKNEELIIVTLLNYCWPVLIYVFRIFLFKLKIPVPIFITGVLLSLSGITIALIAGNTGMDIERIIKAGSSNIIAYSLAFFTAVSWALYSNFIVKYKMQDDLAAMPVLFLCSSLIFFILLCAKGDFSTIHFSAITSNPELLYIIVGPTSLAYIFWYLAIKHGNKILVTALSFFIPLLSMLLLNLKLRMDINLYFWLASFLLIFGSYICYRSFRKVKVYND